MNKGFYLTLMMGGFNASPVPQAVIDALTDGAGNLHSGQPGRVPAQIHLGKTPRWRRLHAAGFFDPRQRVIIAVTVNGATEVLMDGIVTKQDLRPSSAAGQVDADHHRRSISPR